MNETFTVYENGEAVQPSVTERAVSHVQAISGVLLHKVGQLATELITPAYLEYCDAHDHTNYRAQYFEQKRQARAAAVGKLVLE